MEVSSVEDNRKGIVHTSAIGLNVFITQLILLMALSHTFDHSIDFMFSSARWRSKRGLLRGNLLLILWHGSAGFDGKVMRWG